MNHQTLREKVVDLALDALDPGEAREVEAHLAGCPGCAAELASLRATRSAMAGLPPLPAPERGEPVLLAAARQAAEQAEVRRPGLLPRWFWGAAFGAAAAAAVVLVTLQLTTVPPANRFDEGREALAGRLPAPQPAPEPAASPALAPPAPLAPSRGPEEREERVAEAKKERSAGAAGAVAPVAQAPAARPVGDAWGRGEIGVLGAADAAAEREPAATRSASTPPPPTRTSEEVAGSPAPPPPARARKAAADQDPRVEPLARASAADAGAAEAKAGAKDEALRPAVPPPPKLAPQPFGYLAPAAPSAAPRCPGERSRTLERDAAGRLVRRIRTGALDGREYRAEERFGPEGHLLGATLLLDGREVPLRAGDPEPVPGLRLAATAAEAEAAPPACGP